MARTYIGKAISIGVLALCVTMLFTLDGHSQGFQGTTIKVTISGNVGLPGVTMEGLPGSPQTDENGVYSAEVDFGWSGTVTPRKRGYTFEPSQRTYPSVEEGQNGQDYLATLLTYTVTFSTGQPDVILVGLSVPEAEATTDQSGRCTVTLPFGTSASVYPQKAGYEFDPSSQSFTDLAANQTFTFTAREIKYTISGNAVEAGVVMQGLPGNPRTDQDGNYTAQVPYEWTGTVTPMKEGCTFSPPSRSYTKVAGDMPAEHYGAEVDTFQISGSAGMAGVVMEGFDVDVVTDEAGYYIATVRYGWSGTVKPSKPGYTFSPPSRTYPRVTSNSDGQDYTGTMKRFMIIGNAGRPNIRIEGFPTQVTTDTTGSYRVQVDWGWAGTITPVEEGISFEPQNRTINSVTADMTNQNFAATPITYTISGNVGKAGVRLRGLPRQGGGDTVSGADGSYSAKVPYGWDGEVTPEIPGFMFEPPSRTYEDVLYDHIGDDYIYRLRQYTVSGRILDKTGNGVADVDVYAPDALTDLTVTDENGAFEITVEHGWQNEIKPQRRGYTFVPATKRVGPVTQDSSNNIFTAEPLMLSITDSIVFGDQPLPGVAIKLDPPTGSTGVTNEKGVFTVKVPYGWTGDLIPEKRGIKFNPDRMPYTNVTENIDKTRPAQIPTTPTTPTIPPTRPTTPTIPPTTPTTPTIPPTTPTTPTIPPTTPTTPTIPPNENVTVDPEKEALQEQIRLLQEQNELLRSGGSSDAGTGGATAAGSGSTSSAGGNFGQQDLISVLQWLSDQTGVPIGVDLTVKPGAVMVNRNLQDLPRMPLASALAAILPADEYTFKRQPDGTYLVYRPVTTSFFGDDLAQDVLPTISGMTGVDIMPDSTVAGPVWATLDNAPLSEALEKVLAGSAFIATRRGDYYIVSGRNVTESATGRIWPEGFGDTVETKTVRLNHITPTRAKELLSSYYQYYVMADPDPNSRLVTIQAPGSTADKIAADLKKFDQDQRPRQVMIDARIVAMESTDLMDLGVEWQFPQIAAGMFRDSYTFGDKASNLLDTAMPWGFSVGYSPDRSFTNSLLMYLNLLQQRGKADIVSHPQMIALDGQPSKFENTNEDYIVLTGPETASYYVQSQFETITSGTILRVIPRIGDNGDITLNLEVEVSETAPESQVTGLPRVSRRRSTGTAMVHDGGTVALAGLTETRSQTLEQSVPGLSKLPLVGKLFTNKSTDASTKEIAVFITAYTVPDEPQAATTSTTPTTMLDQRTPQAATPQDFTTQLERSLANYQ